MVRKKKKNSFEKSKADSIEPLNAQKANVPNEILPVVIESERARWKHYLRFAFFMLIIAMFLVLLLTSYDFHIIHQSGFSAKEILMYFLCGILLIPVLPSILLEIDSIRADEKGLSIKTLIFKRYESWDSVSKFINPVYLKFAILKCKTCFYLLNRRDLSNFTELVELIEKRSLKLPK